VQNIQNINVWNRTDCCGEALTNFYVFVSDNPFTANDVASTQNQSGVSTYYVAGQGGVPTTIGVNRTGRYVRVQLGGYERLSVAEVQVFGDGDINQVHWLVSDHLGTPRIIFDQSGSLATVKRHDYAPFGEELITVSGRASLPAYIGGDNLRQQFTLKERDIETGLDYFLARYYSSTQGRFTSPDPLYIELRRLGDPQQLNLYAYTRNNPLKFIDATGLDITVTGTEQDDYLKGLQKNVSFQVQLNSTNKVEIVDAKGNALDKKGLKALEKTLKGSEKELFKAITDTKNHVTIDTLRSDANVDFGRFDGGGKNTLDFADTDLLDASKNAGGLTSAQVIGHETLEAYASSKGKNLKDAHGFANKFFGGLELPIVSTLQIYSNRTGGITGASAEFPVHGRNNVREKITRQFLTPIPINAIPTGHVPAHIVDVEKKP
jgi:RHS repeat-associated protein